MKSRISWEIIVIGIVIIGYSVYFGDWGKDTRAPQQDQHAPDSTIAAPIEKDYTNVLSDAENTPGDGSWDNNHDDEPIEMRLESDTDTQIPDLLSTEKPVAITSELETVRDTDASSPLTSSRESAPSDTGNNLENQKNETETRERMSALGEVLSSVGSAVDGMSGAGEFDNRFNEEKASLISEERFPAFALAAVDVDIETGHIQLTTHSGSDVIVQVWVADRNQSGEFERFYRTVVSKNPESVQVRIERIQRDEHWTSRLQRLWATDVSNSITAGVRVLVPEGGLTYKLRTQSGNIEAMNAGGDITLETRAGNLTLVALYGRTVAETRAGNIRANKISGTTALRTRAGNIQADEIRANTELRTRAGNITASIHSTNQRIDAESRVGNVNLSIPSPMRADISIDGSSATLDEHFEFDGERASQYIRGTINGGGPLVRVHARVGNASVRSNNDTQP
ncbi:MAG: DUF4097 family beta strand repeat protein [Bacteroidetes bacterium]|nr:DUF4097 family beta strand repeat protein [Bacteroidota bacterium]MCH8524702.1 DUF4097 family beta strand repeat-containing protein [Balneolales bacterium]